MNSPRYYYNFLNSTLREKYPLIYQILKEIWIPIIGATTYTYFSLFSETTKISDSGFWKECLNSFASSFFFFSWAPSQFLRIKKQLSVEKGLKTIINDLDEKTKNLIGHVTGGDSGCFLSAVHMGDGTIGNLMVCQLGAYPMFDIHTRIVDLQHFKLIVDQGQNITPAQVMAADTYLPEIRCLTQQIAAPFNNRLTCPYENYAAYNIFFTARNGRLVQNLIFRRINGEWERAIRVTKHGTDECVYKNITDRFPLGADGEVQWAFPPHNQI